LAAERPGGQTLQTISYMENSSILSEIHLESPERRGSCTIAGALLNPNKSMYSKILNNLPLNGEGIEAVVHVPNGFPTPQFLIWFCQQREPLHLVCLLLQ
jgi:hypothetical protein